MNNTDAHNREEIPPPIATNSTIDQPTPAESHAATHEEIEKQAYCIYEKNGCQAGTSEQDWYEAEREITKEIGQEDRATERMVNEGGPVPDGDPVSPD